MVSLSLFGDEKKLRIGWASANGSGRRTRFECSQKKSGFKCETSPLSNFQTPALIDLCAGRITVDAREKD